MLTGIYQGSAALTGLERWQDATSQNIANSSVSGYKAIGVGLSSERCDKFKSGSDFETMLRNETSKAQTRVYFEQGQLVPSGNPMDCAIDGDGFFQVRGEDGGTIYSRNGQFRTNSDDQLVDVAGRVVLGSSGAITVNPSAGPVRIEADGQVYQGDTQVAKLAIASIKDMSSLVPAGGGYVGKEGAELEVDELDEVRVVQGFYEASNVSPMREMINMIAISRAYEANQRVISTQDSILGRITSTFSV